MHSAYYFIILLGIVSLFADVVYEGARSISGQYLSLLGANAAIVATAAGFGEFIGYVLRLPAGYISDRTKNYWFFTIIGYVINLAAVPLLALTSQWQWAVALMVIERFGKAIRVPARDAMLSYATKSVGAGRGFGIHRALDQIGAIVGPLCVTGILLIEHSYALCFALLSLPACFSIITLLAAKSIYPTPENLEIEMSSVKGKKLPKTFWIYLAAISLIAAGYADFPFIAYHFLNEKTASSTWIPIFYAIAMGMDGLAAYFLGPLYDRLGISVLIVVSAISAFFAPLVFLGGFFFSLFGMILWGIGLGAQGSIMRAVVANIISKESRGTAYGILNAGFGISWFFGSVIMGMLYGYSIPLVILFSMTMQLLALPFFLIIKGNMKSSL